SISFRPMATRHLKKRIFFSASMGSISDWLPSRRSVDSQIGALSSTLFGQVRSGRLMGAKAWYLLGGSGSMLMAKILSGMFIWPEGRRSNGRVDGLSPAVGG